ncbi:hypothetical protein BH09PSE5_BH09PSE5_08740 [soil metagenome]
MSTLMKNLRQGLVGAVAVQSLLFAAGASAETIKMGLGIDAAYAPFFVAQQRGDFKKAGLDVELVRFTQGGEAVDALVAGQIQVSGAAEMTTIIRLPRGDLKALAIYEESGTYIKLAVRPGITSANQIKKFGIVKGSSSEYATFKTMQKFNIDPKSVQLVATAPPELPALMSRGDIDAFIVWEPWPGIALKQGGTILATSGEVGYTYSMVLAVSGKWLDANKETAAKILKVLDESNKQIAADPVKASQDLQAATKLPAADTVGFLRDTKFKMRDFTAGDVASFAEISEFLATQKITPTKVDASKYLQQGFWKE